jgi:hypothetical protein|tara:strand:- start:662 stop:949 length:288 start_codon:yes stop_codon:yes gene_type:complete
MIFEDDEHTQERLREFWTTDKFSSPSNQSDNNNSLIPKRKRSERIKLQKRQKTDTELKTKNSIDSSKKETDMKFIDSSKFWSGELFFNYNIVEKK